MKAPEQVSFRVYSCLDIYGAPTFYTFGLDLAKQQGFVFLPLHGEVIIGEKDFTMEIAPIDENNLGNKRIDSLKKQIRDTQKESDLKVTMLRSKVDTILNTQKYP